MDRSPRHPLAPARAGLTIAEALAALTVLTIGVLALLGTTARLGRDELAARAIERATSVLSDRVERIAGARCADSAGVRTVGGIVERWRTARADDVTTLVDTVSVLAPGGRRMRVALAGAVRCGP
jgi:Tfp pilus assembly protein PilV